MSDHLTEDTILLVGAGQIAIEYAKVLTSLNVPFVVVGRGSASAETFKNKTGIRPLEGGLEKFIASSAVIPKTAIIAVGIDRLSACTSMLISHGTKQILVEKPGGLLTKELDFIIKLGKKFGSRVFIAYNRRFFASTLKAQEIIQEDGGVTSFNFEFTEWSHEIRSLSLPKDIKERWLIANSSHVADLAFFLGGKPKIINCYTSGMMDWHHSAAVFAGSGISENGAIFSYQANWDAPGRWGVEILTKNYRLIFRPMEQLHVQRRESTIIEKIEIDDMVDINFKPGFYRQVKCFINNDTQNFQTIQNQYEMLTIFNKMAGYEKK